jgi:type I restriction enzyme, S subunit
MTNWPTTKLGRVVQRAARAERPIPGKSYRQIGVKLWGEGAYERETMDGSQTKYAELFRAESGDIIVNKIWARNGSVAVVHESEAGCYASSEFPMFAPNPEELDSRWIHWLTKTPGFWAQCDEKSRGTSGKNRIRPEQFLSVEIPLPALDVQRQVVARIEELVAKIREARTLRDDAAKEADAMLPRATSHLLDRNNWAIKPLGEILAASPRNGLSPKQRVESGGRGMLRINAVSSSPTRFVDITALKQVEVSDEVARPFLVENDDVFIVRYNGDINRVAKPAIYKGANERRIVYPDKLMRLRPERAKMTPDFLVYALSSRSVRDQIEEIGKTTAGNIGISGANAKSFKVPVPPLDEQNRIVADLDALQAEVDAMKSLQAKTAHELDALLPSILDKAFKGEL